MFRTAYFVAKNNKPYLDFHKLVDLQIQNGLHMGKTLHSKLSCANIIDCIADTMRKKLCSSIISKNSKVSVFIDESTSVASQSVLIVYLRSEISDGCVNTFFLDIIELKRTDAETIEAELLKCLSKHGFSSSYLNDNLIGACSDGASVMLGRNSGVLERLKNKYNKLFKWHCLCHRIELGVADAIEEVPGVNHIIIFLTSCMRCIINLQRISMNCQLLHKS